MNADRRLYEDTRLHRRIDQSETPFSSVSGACTSGSGNIRIYPHISGEAGLYGYRCRTYRTDRRTSMSEKKREALYDVIINEAISYSVAIIGQDVIDNINILNATKTGVTQVIEGLDVKPDLIIIDALEHIDTKGVPYESIIKGDAKCYSIGAASIIAKVTRDRIMREWDNIYPQYGFAQHKGYGTKMHMEAIREYGLTPIHRRSFTKNIVHN